MESNRASIQTNSDQISSDKTLNSQEFDTIKDSQAATNAAVTSNTALIQKNSDQAATDKNEIDSRVTSAEGNIKKL